MAIVFWMLVLFFLNFGGALVRILIDPEWYYRKKLAETGTLDFGGTTRVVVIKSIQLLILGGVIAILGQKLGYW